MSDLTKPIRVVFDTKSLDYRLDTWLAYTAVFVLAAGDAVRYLISWWGWGAVLVALLLATVIRLVQRPPRGWRALLPLPFVLLSAWMLASLIWSAYPAVTAVAVAANFATSLFALYLAANFSWRHLLRVFANVLRFVLVASFALELWAAAIVRGPIAPIFGNYEGDVPPDPAYYWIQGNLFNGERIQGIVGNANLLGFVALLGLVVFGVEYAIQAAPRWASLGGLTLSVLAIVESKSAGIGFALVAVAMAAVVSIAAEGKPRAQRHGYYRVAIGIGAVASSFILLYREQVFELLGKTPDMSGRLGIWDSVLDLLAQRPVLGWGWISHWVPGVEPYEGLAVIEGVPYYQAHNAFLDVLMQLGPLGLGLLLWLLIAGFIALWRLAVRHTSALYLWPVLVLVGVIVQNLTESRMLIEIGWLLLALLVFKVRAPASELEPRGRSPKRARLLARGLRRSRPRRHTGR